MYLLIGALIKCLLNYFIHFSTGSLIISQSFLPSFNMSPPISCTHWKYLLPLCNLTFHSLNVVFWWRKVPNFNVVNNIFLWFFMCIYKIILACSKVMKIFFYMFLRSFITLFFYFRCTSHVELINLFWTSLFTVSYEYEQLV